MPKAMSPTMSSPGCGRIGAFAGQPTWLSAASTRLTGTPWFEGTVRSEDEREHQAEQGQRLGEGEAQERDGLQHAPGLGLAGHAVDVGGEDQADTHTGANGRKTETDEVQVAVERAVHVVSRFLSVRCAVARRRSGCGGSVGSVLFGEGAADVQRREQGEDVGL